MADAGIPRAESFSKVLCCDVLGPDTPDCVHNHCFVQRNGGVQHRVGGSCVDLGYVAQSGLALRLLLSILALLITCSFATPAWAVTPESPEVRKLIEAGLKSLNGNSEERLGGRCLIGLAFFKNGASPDNSHIVAAVKACQNTTPNDIRSGDVYSNGLAIIFLTELDANKYRDLIVRFAGSMASRQKSFGAWGYESFNSGDTSQTQYAALCTWELLQVGMSPGVEKIEACANWLLRTQDPSGAWGYQGKDPGNFKLVKQNDVTLSMLAAGLGSTMIYGNVLGLTKMGASNDAAENSVDTPSALRRADVKKKKRMRTLKGNGVDRKRLLKAISNGQSWYDKNYSSRLIEDSEYPAYVLYSMERYKSFEELLVGDINDEPQWYQDGYKYLRETELKGGGWESRSGQPCATAFSVLFLLRSTQKSIKANLGQGTLIGGRGLSANLSRMKMVRGRLVTEEKPTDIDNFLGMLDGENSEALEALMQDPTALQVKNVGPEEARRLQQLARSGEPAGRVLAVHALGKLRKLDYVPTLLYAMTDPDPRVVRAARDGLRFVSRRFQGYGLSDNFTDSERYSAIVKWKKWYRRVRPNAPPLP